MLPAWALRVPAASGAPAEQAGLTVTRRSQGGRPILVLRSSGRFELQIDQAGIASWCDLRYDPQCATNLVPAGRHLVEQRDSTGALLGGPWSLTGASPVSVRVAWSGRSADGPFQRSYTVWAAGQIALDVQSPAAVSSALARDPHAITGAFLQADPGAGTATLFLDAWTGEDRGSLAAPAGGSLESLPAGPQIDPASAAISLAADAAGAQVQLPADVGLRAPRFTVSGWPGPDLSLRRGDTTLAPGQDYLATWDAASGLLSVQYLNILPPGGDPASRSFSFSSLAADTLSLGVAGRSLDPASGLLLVDGNMPDYTNTNSTRDTFAIPYIQSTRTITLTGAYSGGAAGIEFVLVGVGSTKVLGAAGQQLQAAFNVPSRGEYSAQGYLIDAGGNRLSAGPDDSIPTIGVGRVIVTIGDSITAGAQGDAVSYGDPTYPVTDYTKSPAYSADRRNIFQYDNYNDAANDPTNGSDDYKRGYQVSLNDNLTTCTGAPVFILNDGFSSLRITPLNGKTNVDAMSKRAAYSSHIRALGAQYVLLQLGTNDAGEGTVADEPYWSNAITQLITGLQTDNPGLSIWLARVPYAKAFGSLSRSHAISYNAALPTVVSNTNSAAHPVYAGPDFYTYFFNNQSQLSADNLHPNQSGYEAMADLWGGQSVGGVAAIANLPCAVMQAEPTLPPLPTPTASPTVTPNPSGDPNSVWLPLIRRP